MRELLGLALAHAVLIGVGVSALRAVGLREPGWLSVPAAIGPGLVIGVCLVALTLVVLLVVGVPFTLLTALVVSGLWGLGAWLVVRWREGTGGGAKSSPRTGDEPASPSTSSAAGRDWVRTQGSPWQASTGHSASMPWRASRPSATTRGSGP